MPPGLVRITKYMQDIRQQTPTVYSRMGHPAIGAVRLGSVESKTLFQVFAG
jgi:hypothetical protein